MIKIGGYAMSFEDAADWARRRYPDIDIYDEDVIPNIIEDYLEFEAAEPMKLMCVATVRDKQVLCVLVTHSADDPYATRTCFAPFPLDDYAVELGRKLFPSKEDAEKAKFVTICDPFDKGY